MEIRVWTYGCFDCLHLGHLKLLAHAASLGSKLHIGLDSDTRIRARKGVARPVQNQDTRHGLLKSLRMVHDVIPYNTDLELERMIKEYNPHVMVLGEEYKDKNIIGAAFAKEIVFFPFVEGYSTTEIIKRIKNERNSTNNC
jgi:rfaE bifunctional protein nucleotidyltransferase chain/domain